MSCQRTDDAGAYALGALDPGEARTFAAHLDGCPVCQDTVAELTSVVDTLPMAAPQMVPPPELKDRLMAIVQAEADLFAAAGPEADRAPNPARRRRELPAWLRLPKLGPIAATGMACFVLVFGVGLGFVLNDSTDEPDRTIVAGVAPKGASAVVHVEKDGSGRLVLSGMPAAADGRVWQVWLEDADGKVRPTHALFSVRGDDSRAEIAIDGDVRNARKVMVSDEPPGGSPKPTGDVVIAASLT